MRLTVLTFSSLVSLAVSAAVEFSWTGRTPEASLVNVDGGYVRLVAEEGYQVDCAAVGSPALPEKTILFELPTEAVVSNVTAEISWETLAENVRVEPVAEPVREGDSPVPAVPDRAIYNGTEFWPTESVRRTAEGLRNGTRLLPVTVTPFRWHPASGLLERAAAITVKVSLFERTTRSGDGRDRARPSLKFATSTSPSTLDLYSEHGLYRTNPETNAVEYLLISPPDFFDDWCWYVRQRQGVHTNLRFAVKNTAAIYADYPFGKDLACRNAAEAIHAYLRQAVSNGLQYVVLGGAWLDAQNLNDYTPYFTTGEAMSLSNCVPGIYGFPREDWRQIPADLFYGCLDMNAGQKYPWDNNEDGKYIDKNDCQYNDTYPDVCVSRLTLNPHNPRSGAYNQHALITNYVAKLARGEARLFAGHYRYGMSVASTGSSKLRRTGDRMYYRELEFYDDMYNMFDPRHHDSLEDGEYSTRVRYYDQFTNWRPIRSVKGMMNYTWTETQPTLAAAMDDYYAGDRDFGYVQAHGWAQGAAQFSAYRFATATGLTLFNGGSGPCETGYPDYHVTSGGKKVLQYNVGDAAVTNPDGGALASVNNSRWSWAGGGGGFAAMSYYMLNEMLIGFNGERLDVGHAWLKGVRNYWPAGRWGNTAGWVLSEQFLYGDPLVRLPQVPHVWWTGGESGVWDRTTSAWTNNVDDVTTFDAASNVYFTVGSKLDLNVADEIAAMRLSLPAIEENAVISLAGTGTLKVAQAVDVAGTNATLTFNVAGGVGHNGIRFVTGAGDLVFEGTNKFYVAGVSNARQIALRGGGVTLDVDEFASGSFPLAIDGGTTRPSVPNELRSKNAGGLRRFGSLALTNSYVKLSTVDAFGNDAPMTHALADSTLEIAANVYYQRSGFPEGLNATFAVDGDSSVTSSVGGLWTVKHTTTFVLGAGAARTGSAPDRETHLTLSAETVNAGGKIVITNAASLIPPPTSLLPHPSSLLTNSVTIASAAALSGDVTVGDGIRLVLKELPLSSVTSLTIGKGATIELPDEASGYWQIVPVSSKFTCENDATFVLSSDPTNRLAGSFSKTGSFFREGALYRWTGKEGDWNTYFANRHPKILFGDIDGVNVVTVRVAAVVSPDFAFFSNLKTKYVFEAANDDASVSFSSIYFCGPTEFNVPTYATEYANISTSTSRFSNVASPDVQVDAGAAFALTGSHWTKLRLAANAALVAVPGEVLDWNADTTLVFPDDGQVLIDVGALELDAEPIPLIAGQGHVWSLSDLKQFTLVQSDAELRIVDGALCVAKGDNLKGPYELTLTGATNWNCKAWTAASNAFPKAWADCALDWSQDAIVSISTNGTGDARVPLASDHEAGASADTIETIASTKLTLDCDVHLQTLTIHAGTNDFTIETAELSNTQTSKLPNLSLSTLDLTDCHGTTEIGVDLGAATILTSSSTNGADVVHLKGTGSGTIDLAGVTVILDQPGDWSLTEGAQGVVKVIAPQAYERFRVAKVPNGFKDSALTVFVTDAAGTVIDGFKTSIADGALWCVPPALEALVPPGTNDLTRLAWRDVLGNVVSNVDWSASAAGFKLIGTETSGVVIAKSGFASVWNQLSVSNEVVIYGREILTPSQIPSGNGVLTLAGAFTLKADVRSYPTLLTGTHLKLLDESSLEISHGGANCDATAQDWSGIVGTGRIRFTDSTATWLIVPGNLFAETLRVESSSELGLCQTISPQNPFGVENLSGGGTFRVDWGSGSNHRPVRTVQTGVSEWSGSLTLTAKDGARYATLNVASDAPAPTTNKALIVSGTVQSRTLNIETNGCVILTGAWTGTINVAGLLVITNACATNGVTVTFANGGKVFEVAEDALPSVTAAAGYVEPTYPDDPETPDTPEEADTRVRSLNAAVAAGKATWTQLDWRDTNGVALAASKIDWTVVTNVAIAATNGACRVICDAEAFAGAVKLEGGVTVEARKTCPFTLAGDSAGAVDFRLDPEPTVTCDLLYLQQPASNLTCATIVTVHNRYGREIAAAGEVAYDAAKGKYYLNVQNVNGPTYNCTFDEQYEDSITSPLWFSGSGNLTYKARPEFFETSRAGRALLGTSMDHFAMHSHNGNPTVGMDNINVWSFNFVVKLPTNNGGIVFAWGNKDSGNGIAFARVSENRAGVYAWENGGGVRLIASANAPFASTQYHSYAITFDGETLRLYADGALAQAAALKGKYPSRGFYQWFKMYGQNGGLSNGPTTVIDDFRLYVNTCLTPTSVRKIADAFPPWPEQPTAELDVDDLAWTNLYWSADGAADEPLELVAGAGSLKLDAPVVVSNALAVTGGAVPVKFVGDGLLVPAGGLAVASSLELDASGLDGTNLAACAVADVPYSRWLVRGAYSGTVTVTALPEVPEGYGVRVESFASLGVRLVFTAPRYAFGDAFGLSVGGDTFDDLIKRVGLHPTSPTNWYAYATWTNDATTVGGISVVGSAGGKVDSQQPYGTDASVARYFLHTSFDGNNDTYNGKTNGLSLAGLASRFKKYRVLVYLATDTDGANFGPVTVNGRTYCGVTAGAESGSVTVADSSALAWGKAKVTAATEGVNVVISDVLTGDAVSVWAQRLKNGGTYARAQIAAIEIVEVGQVHEFNGSRYSADVTGTTDWTDGEGEALANHPPWKNGEFSSICLTAKVTNATLTFKTAVTAETFRVVTEAAQSLELRRDAGMALYEIDLTASEGTVVIGDDLNLCGADGAPCVLAAHPKGTLDIAVADTSASQRLIKLADDFDCSETNCTYLVHDSGGNRPDDSWVVLPVDGWLVLQRLDAAKPWYSLTFEDKLTTCLTNATVVPLKEEGTPTYVAAYGDGRAMTGSTPYSSESMKSVPAAWTIHAVAQMPRESNGTLFGYGRQGQRGVGLVTVDANTVAVARWDGSGKYTLMSVTVTNATCQFHAYALVSTGSRLALYVDGACRGSVAAAVNPQMAVVQFGSTYGNLVSGFVRTTSFAIDDWRLYDGVLSPTAIRSLASDFPAWPDYRTAALTADDTDWSDLAWSGDADETHPLLLDSRGGSLAVTNDCAPAHALYATGSALTLRLSGDGKLVSGAGLTLLSGWTIDCSGLDVSNLIARVEAKSPYVHELVQGAYTGGDPTVIGLPSLPDRYSLVVVTDSTRGVWLVITRRVDYVADLTNTTAWASGAGPGLDVHSSAWENDETSTITLTQRVDAATLSFDTSVTSACFKVVSTCGQSFVLCDRASGASIAAYDFSSAAGTVSLSNDIPSGTTIDLGPMTVFAGAMNGTFGSVPSGATVRYAQKGLAVGAASLRAGVTNTFASATVNGDLFNNARLYRVSKGDSLTLCPSGGSGLNHQFAGTVLVEGGRLLLDSANATDRFWFGVCGKSSLTQTGGEIVANAKSSAASGNGCFLFGVNGSGNIPVEITGGTFSVPDSPICFWQDERLTLTVGGTGLVKAKGLWGNGTKGNVTVNAGGTLSVGTMGIAANLKTLTLNGGLLTAHADATTAMALTLGGDVTLAADDGVVHTIGGAIAGTGTMTVGTPTRTGTVRFTKADAFAHNLVLAYGTLDIGTLRPTEPVTRTGGKIQIRLSPEEEAKLDKVTLLPISSGTTKADYIVLTSGGVPVEADWVTVVEGRLTVDTSGMDFSKFVMPFYGKMAADKTWSEQDWTDSAPTPNRIPAVYWGTASNVVAFIDIATNAEVTVPASVTNVTVTGAGTIVSNGKWPTFAGLTNAAAWHGTVRIANMTGCVGQTGKAPNVTVCCTFDGLGNENSTVEMDNVSGWFNGLGSGLLGREHPYALKIGAGGFTMNDGSSDQTYTFARLLGAGKLSVGKTGGGPTMRVVARESAGFTGTIVIVGNAGVTLGTPTKNPGNGRIVVASGATANVTDGAYWTTVDGFELADGATLNVIADGTAPNYTITRGNLTLATNAALTFDGGSDVRDEWSTNGGDIVRVESHMWKNPVTGERQSFTYRFTGKADAAWDTLGNWEKYGGSAWEASSVVPMLEGSNIWSPTVVDGALIAAADRRAVTVSAKMEGWTPQLAILNGATVTVTTLKKLQGSPNWFWIDAHSQLKVNSFGNDSYEGMASFSVASSNGLVIAQNPPKDGATFLYYLKGAGSVSYGATLTRCAHRIARADIQLSEKGLGRAIRSKRLVALTGSGNKSFVWDGATIGADDPLAAVASGTLQTALAETDDLGACMITQRTDGVYLDYVDRAEGTHYVHEVEDGDDMRQVEIPVDWLGQLTNGVGALLSPDDLAFPSKIAAALEDKRAANGLKPWQSYVLGLEPTNATDRVTATLALEDGHLHIRALGLDDTKFRCGVKVRYVLQATDDLANDFVTIREAQTATAFDDIQKEGASMFYRVAVEISW